MEIIKATYRWSRPLCLGVAALFFLCVQLKAQAPLKKYSIRDGRMYIELQKKIPSSSLDSFIHQFDLENLALDRFIRNAFADSLKKLGWKIETNTSTGIVISKPLMPVDYINNSADRIIFTGKHPTLAERFPAEGNGIQYGVNHFRNNLSFTVNEKEVSFVLRNNRNASRVFLSGSFNNWSPDALPMIKTDSGWVAQVRLGPGKYWYKFVVDKNWVVDADNQLKENDGEGNTNSVFFRTNIVFRLDGFSNAKKVYVSGSFNGWKEKELAMIKTGDHWELPLYLAEGTHTYRFIVDGKWMADPGNSLQFPNEFGETNSVIRIGKPHIFELRGYKDARQVFLAGSFNGWKEEEIPMAKTTEGWRIPYTLGPGNYEYKFRVDGKWVTDPLNPQIVNNSRGRGNSYLIIDPNFTFRLKGYGSAKKVFIAGDMNNWSPEGFAMKKEGDDWIFQLHLSPGKHRYKFLVDGKWIIDPNNPLWEQNEFGTGNSVIWTE